MKKPREIPQIHEESTVRVIILYLLEELKRSLDFHTLTEIILWDGQVNYFTFADCLEDLARKGAVSKTGEKGKELYAITPFGRGILENVSGMLLASMKSQLMRSATRLLAFNSTGKAVKARVEPLPEEGGCHLICAVEDHQHRLLEVKLFLDNEDEAALYAKRFDQQAEHIYRGVLALISGDAKILE